MLTSQSPPATCGTACLERARRANRRFAHCEPRLAGVPDRIVRTPGQYYWTSIADRFSRNALSFAVVPARSFANGQVPPVDWLASHLELVPLSGFGQIEAWHLPAILAAIQQEVVPSLGLGEFIAGLRAGTPLQIDPHRLGFAQYVAHAELIPFEESPLEGKSLMAIAGSAGVTIGLMAGAGTPIVLITVPFGILLCTAAAVLGPKLGDKLASLIGA